MPKFIELPIYKALKTNGYPDDPQYVRADKVLAVMPHVAPLYEGGKRSYQIDGAVISIGENKQNVYTSMSAAKVVELLERVL